MSIIMTTPPEAATVVGSPTPSSYCELMSEFSTSPSSLAAATPPDAPNIMMKPSRSRSTSIASEGEPAYGSPKPKPTVVSVLTVLFQ
ncbi:hypothetical protein COOONC_09934 [Cooperia oncophora]